MDKALTSLETIGFAIRSEEDAARFYALMAKKIGNQLVKARFNALAVEEIAHKEMLISLFKDLTQKCALPPKIPGSPETAEKGTVDKGFEQSTIEELLQLAAQREHDAYTFYKKASVEAIDEGSRRILQYLADIEKTHASNLESELEAYLRDKNWYANNPDMQFVGP